MRRGADSGHERAAVWAGRAWAAWRATLAVPHRPTGAGVWRIEAISGRENTVASVWKGECASTERPTVGGRVTRREGSQDGVLCVVRTQGQPPRPQHSAPGGPRALLLLEHHAHLDFPSIFVALKFKLSR